VPGRFKVQVQQPCPTVGPLEPGGSRPIEIGELGSDFFRREAGVGELGDGRRFGHVGEQSAQGEQGPPAVDAAVPVEASEKDRVELARRAQVQVAVEDMVELVRIFARDMAERDAREPRGELRVEFHRNAAK
jgi:hypothetical protein